MHLPQTSKTCLLKFTAIVLHSVLSRYFCAAMNSRFTCANNNLFFEVSSSYYFGIFLAKISLIQDIWRHLYLEKLLQPCKNCFVIQLLFAKTSYWNIWLCYFIGRSNLPKLKSRNCIYSKQKVTRNKLYFLLQMACFKHKRSLRRVELKKQTPAIL